MAFTGTYSTPATGDAAMRALLDAAIAAGWTVPSSSDGSTYNSSGNQITADSGAGSFANAGAWARLRQPGGGREMLFQRGSTSVLWRVLYSVAGFVGGSPGATRVPTATDQQFLIGAGTDASPTYATTLSTNGTYRWLLSFDAASPYDFWAAGLATAGLNCVSMIFLLSMEAGSYGALDLDPYIALVSASTPMSSTLLTRAYNAPTDPGIAKGWYRYTAPSGGTWYNAVFPGLYTDTGGNGSWAGALNHIGYGYTSANSEEVPGDIACQLRTNGTAGAHKGRVKSAKWVMGSAAYGSHLTDGNANCWVRVGETWLRWDAIVPAL